MIDFFIGRDALLDGLRPMATRHPVLLEGARGIGKSEILSALEATPPLGWTPLRVALDGVDGVDRLTRRFSEHAHLRRNRIEDWLSSLLEDWRHDDPWDQLEALLTRRSRGPVLVLLDEVQTFLDLVGRRDPVLAAGQLKRIDRLARDLAQVRFLLTGSITLRPIAAQLGVALSADWHVLTVPPLDRAAGAALFEHHHDGVCDDAAALLAWDITGGRPRWLIRLAMATPTVPGAPTSPTAVREGVERLLDVRPFGEDLGHLDRHPSAARLRAALRHAAAPGATRASVLTAIQATATRGEAEDALDLLRAEFFLDDNAAHTLPLLALALRRTS